MMTTCIVVSKSKFEVKIQPYSLVHTFFSRDLFASKREEHFIFVECSQMQSR